MRIRVLMDLSTAMALFRDRQEARDDRAPPLGALHLDRAPVLLEDPMADRQAEPEALVLRREERIAGLGAARGGAARALARHLSRHRVAPAAADGQIAEE